ncbi:MAG: ABC transporter substrate-binding protein [Desulfobacula sp.]|uniref:ABC transporter substrate-binding protein n=1 Tax=Desulfobacula sp. TaxID=2593537 RepID=UPI0025BCEE7A|nr:ABC transporter substrate-binding protein [Desulfobacula sp.]MCD4721646.1 ABC transporter substrate-binding protein [Desulfobacula sp.]
MKDNPCLRIGHLKIVDHLILGIADLQLKNNEINLSHSTLETLAMNSWEQVCDGLKEGDINSAFITAPLAMDLFAKGLDIRVLMFTHRSGSVIVKNKAAGINNIADFKGKTVLVPSELCIQNMLLHRLLSTVGLKLGPHDDINADVAGEVVNPFLMTELLMNDQDDDIAGFAVAEPFGSEAVDKGIVTKVCTSQSLWKDHPCCVFVLNKSFMGHYLEAVKEIISLFIQTGQRIENAKDDEILSMAHHFLGQKKKVIQQVLLETGIGFNPSLLIPDIEALNIIQNYMTDVMRVLKNKIDMNHFVDSTFITNTLSEAGQ